MRWLAFEVDDDRARCLDADRPQRPSLPPLFVLAGTLWASCAAVYTLARLWPEPIVLALAAAGALACGAACIWLARFAGGYAALAVLGLALGVCCGCAGAHLMAEDARLCAAGSATCEFRLVEDASKGDFGSSALAVRYEDGSACGRVMLSFPGEEQLLCGAVVSAHAAFAEPSAQSEAAYWSRGICARARITDYELVALSGVVGWLRRVRALAIGQLGLYGGEQAGILQALSCGYRQTIEETGAYAAYKATGLAHIVAVSGAHLSLVTAMLGSFLKLLRMPRFAVLAASCAFALAYLVLAGMPLSAVRAAGMVLLSFGAQASRRRNASLNALGVCVIAFIALEPSSSVSASLFLSAGSTCGIILFSRLVSSWFGERAHGAGRIVVEPLALTLSSNIVTLPYSAALFSQLPLIAPVANVVATPLFTLACVTSLVASLVACAIPSCAQVVVSLAAVMAMPLEGVVSALAQVPHACVAVSLPVAPMIALACLMCAVLWLSWPSGGLRVLGAGSALVAVGIGVLLAAAPWLHGDEIVMLDVGQGDAFLVRSGGACVLVDTGNQDAKLRSALGRHGVYALDGVVISHADDDHCASLGALGEVVDVAGVYVAADALSCACEKCASLREEALRSTGGVAADLDAQGDRLCGLEVGDEIQVGRFTLSVVWPHAYEDEGGNADSLCLVAAFDGDDDGVGDWSALFCGDAEAEQLEQMLAQGSVSAVDVLKVGHHGSRVALSDKLASELSPAIGLISVGAHNRYGHPSDEAIACLEREGAQVLRSDTMGDVRISFSKDALSVSTQR